MWRLLDSFVEDIDRYCSPQYDMSISSFNDYVTETITNATRMYFRILSDAEYNALPSNSKTIFVRVVQGMCSLAAKTSEVRLMNVSIITTLNLLVEFAHHRGVKLGNLLEAQVKEVGLSTIGQAIRLIGFSIRRLRRVSVAQHTASADG